MVLYWKLLKGTRRFLIWIICVYYGTIRFFVEFNKEAQVEGRDDYVLFMNTGQLLSIPLILVGLYFYVCSQPKPKSEQIMSVLF
jgi:prolipoprotein diacylglyceryltransferase